MCVRGELEQGTGEKKKEVLVSKKEVRVWLELGRIVVLQSCVYMSHQFLFKSNTVVYMLTLTNA
jgi:diaminopimelate decarboxylase